MENIPQAVLIGIELLRPGKNFFPDIQGAEFEEMVEDIREHGIHDPLSVVRNDDGTFTIISGQQRYRAAKKAKLKVVPCYIDEGDPIAAIISTNFYRRHFTKEERELYKAKKKMMEEEIIREDILPKLIPDLIKQYEKGKLTLNQAARIACRIPKTLQKALLKDRIATVVEDTILLR